MRSDKIITAAASRSILRFRASIHSAPNVQMLLLANRRTSLAMVDLPLEDASRLRSVLRASASL